MAPYITVKEFLKRAKKWARKNEKPFEHIAGSGKGSHGRIIVGKRQTTIKGTGKGLGYGLYKSMLKQLDIPENEF